MSDKVVFVFPFGFIFLGILFVTIACCVRRARKKTMARCTVPVVATVVDVREERMDRNMGSDIRTVSYYPVYEYTYDLQTIRRKSNIGGKFGDNRVGDHKTLLVDAEYPEKFYDPGDQLQQVCNIFWLTGFGLLVFGLATFCLLACISA